MGARLASPTRVAARSSDPHNIMKTKFLILNLALCSAVALTGAAAADKDANHPGSAAGAEDVISVSPGSDAAEQSATATRTDKQLTQSGVQNPVSPGKFAQEAAQGGMVEIELGKLAQMNAGSNVVKEFGAMMVRDHTAATTTLQGLASQKNIELPNKLDSGNAKLVEDLARLNGEEFDKQYISKTIIEHGDAIVVFKEAAANCTDSDLKDFAATLLPTLEMHLDHALAIQNRPTASNN